jgi:hypothetical protein
MAQVARHGHNAVGRASIRAQWLGVAVSGLLSSVFVLILAWFIGWPLFRRLWPRRDVAPGSAHAPDRQG